MKSKEVLLEQMERERKYLNAQGVGTDEYNASMKRMLDYEEKLADIERFENEKKHKIADSIIKVCTTAIGVAVHVGSMIYITATEKEHTYRGELKGILRDCFFKSK